MKGTSRAPRLRSVLLFSSGLVACGGGAPPPAPTAPAPRAPVAVAPPPPAPDLSAVPEPEGLVVVGRVQRPQAILDAVGTWTRLPLPPGSELVGSMIDEGLGTVVDLSQPVDGAALVKGAGRSPSLLAAVSIPVRSLEEAKARLGETHRIESGPNGQFFVHGVGRPGASKPAKAPKRPGRARGRERDDIDEEEDDDGEGCVLAPAPGSTARLVCGERDALDALVPYLTRTAVRQAYTSDVHVELRPAPVKQPLLQLRAGIPLLARSVLGSSSPAMSELIDASVGELVDFIGDTRRLVVDAQIKDAGVDATMRVEYATTTSLVARIATARPDRSDAPPASFWHLPGDTDLALFGRGAEPKLFDRPRELLANVALEVTESAGMPQAERSELRGLLVDRTLPLFTGPLVYGKGFDLAAVEKALDACKDLDGDDIAARDEAKRVLVEQVVGWHLVQVGEPITKVGPILKDWAQLWNRPAFAKWAKQQTSSKMVAQVRTAPMPAGVTLPKDAVHLQVTIPRPDLEDWRVPPAAKKNAKPKTIKRKPVVFHVIAVPDAGTTWLGFGLDGKLVARKAAAALSSAPDRDTLGKAAGYDELRSTKVSGAASVTLQGLLVVTAIDGPSRSPFRRPRALTNKGVTPIVLTSSAEPPSADAPAGSAVSTFRLPRGAIEDIVTLAMSSR